MDRFTRVRCKTGVLRHGALRVHTASADLRRPTGDPYIGQVDAFAVYSPELDASFLVAIEDLRARQVAASRIDASASNQQTGFRWAAPYSLASQRCHTRQRAEDGIRTRDPVLGPRRTAGPQTKRHAAVSLRSLGRQGYEGPAIRWIYGYTL